jgi:hypothetical protein
MDAALKAKWVAALRSGEYQQGKGKFEHDGKFCCLGVLCKVAGLPTRSEEGLDNNFTDVDSDEIGICKVSWALAAMNDNGKTFPEIADYIEANL